MLLSEAIDQLVTATEADGRSVHTIVAYRRHLKQFLEFCGDVEVGTISAGRLREYALHLRRRTLRYAEHPFTKPTEGGLSPHTVNTLLRAVKRLFSWLQDEGALQQNPAQRIKLTRPPAREPKAIDFQDFVLLLQAVDENTAAGLRDRAILMVLADTGCRVGGLTHLRLGDVDLEHCRAKVSEKGEQERFIYFGAVTQVALAAWLAQRPAAAEDWVFTTLGSRESGSRLTEEGVGESLRRLKRRAGVQGKVNPHAFRHGFARQYLENGGDLSTLSQILGHSDAAVTSRHYARFQPSELQAFHRRHSPVDNLLGNVRRHGELRGSE